MTKLEQDLGALAEKIVIETLHEGKKKHPPNDFLLHPDYHLDRAIRHICTARLIRDGHLGKDAEGVEGHLKRAITRLVMALHQT